MPDVPERILFIAVPMGTIIVVVTWNKVTSGRKLLAWDNFYLGLPLSIMSFVVLLQTLTQRLDINPVTDFWDALFTLLSFLLVFSALIVWTAIFALQIGIRRRYQHSPPPVRHIMLAGCSNLIGFGTYILFVLTFAGNAFAAP